ncbi:MULTISPECIES: hypothetical protein [Pasteurellaceae]|uniref:hypothetical protein n=1 Tax=Pasteurellaceae TaxID=712 RepID=UPI0005098F8F
MHKCKLILFSSALLALFACTSQSSKTPKTAQLGYLKTEISAAELANPANFKRYYYTCSNLETAQNSYLITYFPLSRESRKPENFGIYFQLDGGQVEPFDHIVNQPLNARATRFEVIYRSYRPIDGAYVDLIARQSHSAYYKNGTLWLACRGG